MNSDFFQLALSYHQAGLLEQAGRIYEKLLESSPHDANLLHIYGILSAQLGEYDKAKNLIKQALKLDPTSPTYHNSMGNVLWYLEDYENAIKQFEKSIELEPNAPVAHNNLANMYAKREENENAIKHYQSAILLKPDYADAYYNLAIVLIKTNQPETAIRNLEEAIRYQPHFTEARHQLARVLQQQNQLEPALHHYLEVLDALPNDSDLLVNIGAILVKQGKLLEAIDYFNQALAINPEHHEAHFNLGATQLSLQNADEALRHYLRCLSQKPDAEIYYNIGVIYMYKDRYFDAIDYFNNALQIRPKYYEAEVNLGATYLKLETYGKAIQHYERALQIKPDNEEIKYILSAIKEEQVTPEKAPLDFVEHLFDQYAPYFEKHLLECLSYQAHLLLHKEVTALLNDPKNLKIVDLGCGTGLCGELFKSNARHLIGIDISPKMIEVARKKNIYDELIVSDITPALKQIKEIDLLLASDVFGYLGRLESVFEAASKALAQGGHFVFTVEKGEAGDYALLKSTRFVHSKNYIHELCIKNNFQIIKEDEVQLRQQRKNPVNGYIFILKKSEY